MHDTSETTLTAREEVPQFTGVNENSATSSTAQAVMALPDAMNDMAWLGITLTTTSMARFSAWFRLETQVETGMVDQSQP